MIDPVQTLAATVGDAGLRIVSYQEYDDEIYCSFVVDMLLSSYVYENAEGEDDEDYGYNEGNAVEATYPEYDYGY